MSATYKCNFCGKKLRKHVSSAKKTIWVEKPLHKNKNIGNILVKLIIESHQSDLDICENCLEEVKKDALKEFSKVKI